MKVLSSLSVVGWVGYNEVHSRPRTTDVSSTIAPAWTHMAQQSEDLDIRDWMGRQSSGLLIFSFVSDEELDARHYSSLHRK